MKYIFALLLIPTLSMAVAENKVYPNSGSTDAHTDQQTYIANPSAAPSAQAPEMISEGAQEQQEREKVDANAIGVGPYDKDGKYMHVHKKP